MYMLNLRFLWWWLGSYITQQIGLFSVQLSTQGLMHPYSSSIWRIQGHPNSQFIMTAPNSLFKVCIQCSEVIAVARSYWKCPEFFIISCLKNGFSICPTYLSHFNNSYDFCSPYLCSSICCLVCSYVIISWTIIFHFSIHKLKFKHFLIDKYVPFIMILKEQFFYKSWKCFKNKNYLIS